MGMQWRLGLDSEALLTRDSILAVWKCPFCKNKKLEKRHCNECNFDVDDDKFLRSLWISGLPYVHWDVANTLQNTLKIETIRVSEESISVTFFNDTHKYDAEIPYVFVWNRNPRSSEKQLIVTSYGIDFANISFDDTYSETLKRVLSSTLKLQESAIQEAIYTYQDNL